MYQDGNSEKILSSAGISDFYVATKVNPWFDDTKNTTTTTPCGGLRPEVLKKQFNISLDSLKMKKVNLLYLHAPDHGTPIIETLSAINDLYQQHLFDEWGLSNFASWEVVHIYHLCKERNWKPPSVYQGMYNCITRVIEKELFPALRVCGMRFYAYNPLAGGMLSGRYKYEDDPNSGRFAQKTSWGARYRDRYWKKEIFDAIDKIQHSCEKHNISLVTASFSWLYNHSLLKGNLEDGVIIGGSSVEQMTQNLDTIDVGLVDLPHDILKAIDDAWSISSSVCPQYFR